MYHTKIEKAIKQSPFAFIAHKLLRVGYSPLPLVPGQKRPALKAWQTYCEAQPSEQDVASWAQKQPAANVGVALGRGLIAIDVDAEDQRVWNAVLKVLPDSTVKKAGAKGFTAFYRDPTGAIGHKKFRGAAGKGYLVEILASRCQTVLPPSLHPETKRPYTWLTPATLEDTPLDDLPAAPADLAALLDEALEPFRNARAPAPMNAVVLPTVDEATVRSALAVLSSDSGYKEWLDVGMSVHHWSNGSDSGFALWDEWSAPAGSYPGTDALQDKWKSFGAKRAGRPKTIRSLLDMARRLSGQTANDLFDVIDWPKRIGEKRKAHPNSTENVLALLKHIGVTLYSDMFACTIRIVANGSDEEMSDEHVIRIWAAGQELGLRCARSDMEALLAGIAAKDKRHPVREYLAALKWDGTKRLDDWLARYVGAKDTPLVRAFGAKTLIGAVRRVRQPGCKHDTMLVLEGPQGAGKSTVVSVLGGPWFGDNMQLGLDAREMMEQSGSCWLIEAPELSGMTRKEVEGVKAAISRTHDRARMAYGRRASERPRQFILWGTTNSAEYLQDSTGGRRFWPVEVGSIDLEALRRDRDQLWAEAATREASGESNVLPADLWDAASEVQAEKTVETPLLAMMRRWLGTEAKGERIDPLQVQEALGLRAHPTAIVETRHHMAIGRTLQALSYKPRQMRLPGGARTRMYERRDDEGRIRYEMVWSAARGVFDRKPIKEWDEIFQ